MPRYIDADSLYSRVKTHTNPYGKPTLDYKSGVKVLGMINQEPTADVVPESEVERLKHILNCYALQYGTVTDQQKVIDKAIDKAKTEIDLLKSTITQKEEEAYNKGYEDAKADILEKLQADIARDEILAEYGDELFEGRIAGFRAVMNYLAESEQK